VIAGDLTELDSIRALLAGLPSTTYGQVLVETAESESVPSIMAPARVTVTRVVRTDFQAPGGAVSAALASWVAEWMPAEPDPQREVTIWVGARVGGGDPSFVSRLERL
jgi:hypothetical protein